MFFKKKKKDRLSGQLATQESAIAGDENTVASARSMQMCMGFPSGEKCFKLCKLPILGLTNGEKLSLFSLLGEKAREI